jgi:hypothetical protein
MMLMFIAVCAILFFAIRKLAGAIAEKKESKLFQSEYLEKEVNVQ